MMVPPELVTAADATGVSSSAAVIAAASVRLRGVLAITTTTMGPSGCLRHPLRGDCRSGRLGDLLHRFGAEIGARLLQARAVGDVGRRALEGRARSVGLDAQRACGAVVARQLQLAQHADETC